MNEEPQIELKSPAVQEILGHPPRWIIRWGISIIFIIIAGLIVGSYFFKYPDIITATITVTTENLPAGVMAKTTGKIDTLLVHEKQKVRQGDLLAVMESTADWRDVMSIKNYELRITADDKLPRPSGTPSKFEGDISSASFLPSPFFLFTSISYTTTK